MSQHLCIEIVHETFKCPCSANMIEKSLVVKCYESTNKAVQFTNDLTVAGMKLALTIHLYSMLLAHGHTKLRHATLH